MNGTNGVAVKLQDLSFSYPGQDGRARPIYQGLTLGIQSQKVTALMGARGAGRGSWGGVQRGPHLPRVDAGDPEPKGHGADGGEWGGEEHFGEASIRRPYSQCRKH